MSKRAPKFEALSTSHVEWSAWSVAQVLATLDEHDQGVFQNSSLLIKAMMRDERIRADVSTRANALAGKSGLAFSVESADARYGKRGRSKQDKLAAQVHEWWHRGVPETVQRRILRTAIMHGVAYGPINWVVSDGQWEPRLECWDNESLWFDSAREVYVTQTKQGPVDVVPGTGEWFLYTPDGDESWFGGAVRALGLLFMMRRFKWRDWARFCERHGMPLIVIKEPQVFDQESDARAAFYTGIRNMGSTGVVRLPGDGWDVTLQELKAGSYEAFSSFLDKASTAISITLLGQNLSTEVQGGSYAAAQAHLRVRQDYLDADAETFSTALRDQLIQPWGRFNVKGWNRDLAPWPTWDCGLPEDRKIKAETFDKASVALVTLRAAGVPVDLLSYAESFGIPLKEGAEDFEETEAPEPEEKQPGQAQPEEGEDSEDGGDASGAPDEADGSEDEEDDGSPVEARKASAASALQPLAKAGDSKGSTPGVRAGQGYADRVTESLANVLRRKMAPHMREMLRIVEDAETPEEAQRMIAAHYADQMSPTATAEMVANAMQMVGIGGVAAVLKDKA